MIVTLGGSLFAVLTTADSFEDFMDCLRSFLYGFEKTAIMPEEISEQILEMSESARREGLLSLEEKSYQLQEEFLSKGIRLVVDGTDPELAKDIMENELLHREERNRKRIRFWH